MFGIGKKRPTVEEETGCAFCVYAAGTAEDFVCLKKKKAKDAEKGCMLYEYDLLKHRPARAPRFAGWDPEGIAGAEKGPGKPEQEENI